MDIAIALRSAVKVSPQISSTQAVLNDTGTTRRQCKDCLVVKPIKEFNISKVVDGKTYYRHDCKPCKIAKAKALIKTKQTWFTEYKKTLKCATCGNADNRVLEFHHEDPKTKEIAVAEAINSSWHIDRIKNEISKCSVLCGNCHRIHHHEERVAAKKKK